MLAAAGDELVDVSGLPWPDPAGLGRGVRREPARRGRGDGAGRAAAPAGRRAALPGAVLAAGGAGPHRAGRPRRRRGADTGEPSTSTGCARRWPGCSATSATRASSQQRLATAVAALRPAARCSPAARGRARPPPSRGSSRCSATAPAPRRGSRWPHRPARRRPGCRRPCGTAGRRRPPTASTAPCTAAGLAARPQPVPPRPVRPAALRRDRRRRDVDGVADDDGPAARRRASGRPAGAGRRPGPARVGRGRCRPRRPGAGPPRPDHGVREPRSCAAPADLAPPRGVVNGAWSRCTTCWRFRGGRRRSPGRSGRRRGRGAGVLRGGTDDVEFLGRRPGRGPDRHGAARRRSLPGRALAAAARRRDVASRCRCSTAPGAVRAPARPLRRRPVEPRDRAVAAPRRSTGYGDRRAGTPAARCS